VLTERPLRRLKRQVHRGRTSKSRPVRVVDPARKDSNAISPPQPPDFVFLPNAHDQFAVAELRSAPIGKLVIDRLIQDDPQLAAKLREALIQVYLNAAQIRELRKATKRQIGHARSAHKHLTHVLTRLEAVSTDGRDGLARNLLRTSRRLPLNHGAACATFEWTLTALPARRCVHFSIAATSETSSLRYDVESAFDCLTKTIL
jgi:hypothetical protein